MFPLLLIAALRVSVAKQSTAAGRRAPVSLQELRNICRYKDERVNLLQRPRTTPALLAAPPPHPPCHGAHFHYLIAS
jgi:hypothetical protein